MEDYNSIRDWMASHDSHSHGICYASIDLEDEEAYPLEGWVDAESMDSVDDMIDEARDLADMFVDRLSESEARACAMIFGKCHNSRKAAGKAPLLTEADIASVKRRLSGLFTEFAQEYSELAESRTLKSLFSECVLERCENIYRRKKR